ncbi:glycosyltransferase family 4 protein [Psychroflexus montanilacus]|uniref:glycosyltransferase family 4 protein n=1 Tax=Psychroflexus montanilacus TaxID=2873598 RepID=UPI001CC96CEC|nr:glycosyltransferase family 4 protein [Psychroflexus montanilacus]MBZ9652085.1 glycosyltransferase family 4 protein [Psychroflexus montanilacus]
MPQNQRKKTKPKQLLYLGNKLSLKGRNVSTVEVLSSQLKAEGYEVISGSSQKNQVLRLLDMLLMVIKHRSKTHVLLIDTYSTSAFWYAYLVSQLAFRLKLNYIPILHGGNLPHRLSSHPKQCQRLFGRAKVNVAPSAYLMHHFEKAGYTNLSYIPNTINLENYSFKQRRQFQPHLLWVRSFAHIYNPLLALKVLQELLKTHPQAKLSMVGPFKDDSIEDCKTYASEHDLPITFTGGMPKADWLEYTKDFDIFINTTNVDNTPVSVIEAMALGLPVVSTNVGGIPFLLDDEQDALLVNPDDVHAFTEAVLRLLKNPELAHKLSKAGRAKVEHFDWEVVKEKWVEVIG